MRLRRFWHTLGVRGVLSLLAAAGVFSFSVYVWHQSRRLGISTTIPLAPAHRSVCLRANVAQPLVIDSRGMLVGSPRMIYGQAGGQTDSVSVSIAGRIYRWY